MLLSAYKNRAHLGAGGMGSRAPAWMFFVKPEAVNILRAPLEDTSRLNDSQWASWLKNVDSIYGIPDQSPALIVLYELMLYYRGYPVTRYVEKSRALDKEGYRKTLFHYPKNPMKYRCTSNNIVLLTGGEQNDDGIVSMPETDVVMTNLATQERRFFSDPTRADIKLFGEYNIKALDRKHFLTLLNLHPLEYNVKGDIRNGLDAAGKPWNDRKYGVDQKVKVHSIHLDPLRLWPQFRQELQSTGGALAVIDGNSSIEDFYNELDNMIRVIVKGSSNSQVLNTQLESTIHSFQYRVTYDIPARSSSILAYEIDPKTNNWKDKHSWDSRKTVKSNNGIFTTLNYESPNNPFATDLTISALQEAYTLGHAGSSARAPLHDNHIRWLKGQYVTDNVKLSRDQRVMPRVSAIGPVVNSEIANVAKDKEYVNLNFMSGSIKSEFNHYVIHKNKVMENELLVINANDGLIHFIGTQRKINAPNFGKRIAAYFPGFLAYRLPEISGLFSEFQYSVDGSIGIFEFKDSNGDIRTIGVSGMGGGGKGIVGYQIFKATPSGAGSNITFSNTDKNIKPLFEIFNEGNLKSKVSKMTKFENLGYTYSGFEFFNRKHPNGNNGQGIVVFGNGYGNTVSSLYFVDIENGNLIKEIVLHKNGGGASTPTLVVEKDPSTGYQRLKKIFVGDTSGTMYRVDFKNGDIESAVSSEIYRSSKIGEQTNNPITVKPFYTIDEQRNGWIYFGTGRNSDNNYDRGDKSKVVQYAVAIRDTNQSNLLHPYDLAMRILKIDPNDKNQLIIEVDDVSSDNNGNGWIIPLTVEGEPENIGERIIKSPRYARGNILFSTWGLEEYDDPDHSQKLDPCISDRSFSKLIVLKGNTGLKGDLYYHDKNTAGIIYEGINIGSPAGNDITGQGGYSGGDTGKSTLDRSTIDEINKEKGSEGGATNTQNKIEDEEKSKIDIGDDTGSYNSGATLGIPKVPPFLPSRTSILRLI